MMKRRKMKTWRKRWLKYVKRLAGKRNSCVFLEGNNDFIY
jgi:hypothetical protein